MKVWSEFNCVERDGTETSIKVRSTSQVIDSEEYKLVCRAYLANAIAVEVGGKVYILDGKELAAAAQNATNLGWS